MLTRREVLLQFKRVGVTEASQLKNYLRDFEKYMADNHGVLVTRTKKILGGDLLASQQGDYQTNFPALRGTHKR